VLGLRLAARTTVQEHCGLARGVAGCLPVNALPVTDVQQSGVVRFDLGVESAHSLSLGRGAGRIASSADYPRTGGYRNLWLPSILMYTIASRGDGYPHRLSSLRVHPFSRRESHAMLRVVTQRLTLRVPVKPENTGFTR